MRILYICGDMGIEAGGRKGAATHVRETCHALQAFGHDVLLVAASLGDRSELNVPAIEVAPSRSKMLGADLRYLLLNSRMKRELARVITEFKPDVVYERYSLYQTAGAKLCRKFSLPRILEVNTLLAHEQRHRLRLTPLARLIEGRLWRGEKAIICVSTTLKGLMTESAGLDESKMAGFIVSPVAINPDVFHPSVKPVDLSALGFGDRKIAGYMGTMTAWHGVDLFFKAAEILKRGNHSVIIFAVGGEPEKVEKLRARTRELGIEKYLHFHGSIPHSEVPSHLAAMDLCLIADTQDWSSPTKFFEFAGMEKPVVGARCPAIVEVFGEPDHPAGLLFDRGNAEDMVRCILEIIANSELGRSLGRRARRRLLNHYSWRCNIRRIMELYRKMGVAAAVDPGPETGPGLNHTPAEGPLQ
ncbi:MAG: glycosyltransferase family 4 protein [Candidatus Sumerlaeaceae bacterium]|nr:glycosyltransferase family 4 protein [Candidatus Sumerlaeaceae bacterium]